MLQSLVRVSFLTPNSYSKRRRERCEATKAVSLAPPSRAVADGRRRQAAAVERLMSCGRPLAIAAAAGSAEPSASDQQQYYATCHPGLESVVAAELASPAIGAQNIRPVNSGVHFEGDISVGYKANLWLRSAIRVLQLLRDQIPLDSRDQPGEAAYDAVRQAADWPALLRDGHSFSVDARVWSCSGLTSSQLLAVRAKDAICDAVRDRRGTKPDPPPPGRVADLPLFLSAFEDRLAVYRDMSGDSLHRRGWRRAMHKASLNEAAASGLLLLAGWDKLAEDERGVALADPMCGSGTLLIEAAHIATRTAPGSFRRFWPFSRWHDFDPEAWGSARDAAQDAVRPWNGAIWGNDIHSGALSLALRDCEEAGVRSLVRLHHGEARAWQLPRPPQLVATNPPWGGRLLRREGGDRGDGEQGRQAKVAGAGSREEADELSQTWYELSVFLKEQCGGATAAILCGNPEASKALRLRASARHPVTIGGVDCRVLMYGIQGRRREAREAGDSEAAGGAALTAG